MKSFEKTLDPKLSKEETAQIVKLMTQDAMVNPTKSKLDLERFDWDRAECCNARDPRATGTPCGGRHTVDKFRRGSSSGTNAHGLWLTCATCQLRLAYVPTWGAKGVYRSAGALSSDVKTILKENPNASPEDLKCKAIGLEAAEASALQRLEQIRAEKGKMKSPSKGQTSPYPKSPGPLTPETMMAETGGKKMSKRDHDLPSEDHEANSAESWQQVTP